MISELNENKLFKTKIHFKIILEEGFRIIEENKSEFNIYHSLFRRYIYGFESLSLLLNDFNADKKFREQSISIILRAGLLDYLTTLYLATFQAEKKLDPNLTVNYENEVDKIMCEQIRRIFNVSEYDKKFSFRNHQEFCETVDIFYEKFSNLFDKTKPINYNKPASSLRFKSQDDIKSTVIRNRLDSVADRLENIRYGDVFYLYDVYSKYDHFGMTSMIFEHMDVDLVCGNILGAIFHISEGIDFCKDLLVEEANCKSNFEKIYTEICLLRGTIHTKTLWLSPEYKASHQ